MWLSIFGTYLLDSLVRIKTFSWLDTQVTKQTNSDQITNQVELAAQVSERTADKFAATIKGNSTITVVEDRNN